MKVKFLFIISALIIPSLGNAQLRLSLKDLDFGFIPRGDNDQEILFLRNGSKEAAREISCEIEGDQDFSCVEKCIELKPSGACNMVVTFSPTAPGKKKATAYIRSKNMDTVKLNLRGQGYEAE